MHKPRARGVVTMFKQRVVGFAVLSALAVIFWPIVFVSTEPEQELMLPGLNMPERPDLVMSKRQEPILERVDRSRLPVIEHAVAPEEEIIDAVVIDPKGELITADNEPRGQTSARQRAEFDEQGLPVSWELKVATFSTEQRASEVLALLRDKGFKAYLIPIRLAEQELYQVRIGPKLQRQRLLEIKQVIDDYFMVNSVIARFTPT